jgi:predicted HTH transcriptional regulator
MDVIDPDGARCQTIHNDGRVLKRHRRPSRQAEDRSGDRSGHIALNQVDEARLQALITGGAAESRTIDYKRTSYGNANADHSEFLADTSSFANTSGGDLVLGIEAGNGIPTAIVPLTIPIDPEILRLEQIARGGLQPRIGSIAFHPVPIQAGGNVLIVRLFAVSYARYSMKI